MVNSCWSNIIRERRLKLKNRGRGRKTLMDEVDERFLLECISSRATAYGRRHDSVMYLNNRVKKADFAKIVNISRKKRNLPLIKSSTAVYNRSRPHNKRSIQANRHIGLGLFCCKKPPKAEDNDTLQSTKKNIIRTLSDREGSNDTLYGSCDDKAYLCPATSTGMKSARSQTVYQPNDEELARKLPKI